MPLTSVQTLIMIAAVALGAVITRFTPFLLFPETNEQPEIIACLGRMLPPAMMGLLIVYCMKSVSVVTPPHGIPEVIAIAAIVLLHKWKNNTLLSIGGGTLLYMFLVQVVFA